MDSHELERMGLLEYYAAAALTGLLMRREVVVFSDSTNELLPRRLSVMAFDLAEAMVKEARKRRTPTHPR